MYKSGFKWCNISGKCNRCDQLFEDDNLRGRAWEEMPDIYMVDAHGYCPTCRLLTPIRYRLMDRAMYGRSHRTGEWTRYEAERDYTQS